MRESAILGRNKETYRIYSNLGHPMLSFNELKKTLWKHSKKKSKEPSKGDTGGLVTREAIVTDRETKLTARR